MKKLEEYSFVEIIDMKREEFETALSETSMNVGQNESLRKLLSLQYEAMEQQVKALNEFKQSATVQEEADRAQELIEQISSLMFSMEYKATLLYNRTKKLLNTEN